MSCTKMFTDMFTPIYDFFWLARIRILQAYITFSFTYQTSMFQDLLEKVLLPLIPFKFFFFFKYFVGPTAAYVLILF